jgi:hypothetical protein
MNIEGFFVLGECTMIIPLHLLCKGGLVYFGYFGACNDR